ncbi:MAG: hypothetical protein WCW56_01665 [Candidatus Paceibacterota bacterium]|jgi:hypothetical protein
MSFFSRGKKEKESLVVGLIAIGSGGIEAAIAQNGAIVFSAKKDLTSSARDSIENFSTAIYQGLTEVLTELQKSSAPKPTAYHCILPAPLFINGIKTLEVNKDQPFLVDKKLIDSLMAESVKSFMADQTPLFTQFTGDTNRLIENDIFTAELNGYRVNDCLGQKTKSLKLIHGLSYGSNKIMSEIEKTIKAGTQQENIRFHTFPATAFMGLDALLGNDRDDYLVIDAGGEFTDIAVVHDRALVTHFSFPYGFNFMRRSLAESLGSTPADVVSTIKLYFQNKLTDDARVKFEAVVAKERKAWLEYFLAAFNNISATTFVFPTIYLLGDELSTLFIQDFIRDPALQELVINKKYFNLSTVAALLNLSPIKSTMFTGASPFLNLVAPVFSKSL